MKKDEGPDLEVWSEGDAVGRLIRSWQRDDVTFAVLDPCGRHKEGLAPGRIDLSRGPAVRPEHVDAHLRRQGYVLLDGEYLPRQFREAVLIDTLAALRRLRAGTGRPEWILLQDVDRLPVGVLQAPGALDDGAWAFVTRDGTVRRWAGGAGSAPFRPRHATSVG